MTTPSKAAKLKFNKKRAGYRRLFALKLKGEPPRNFYQDTTVKLAATKPVVSTVPISTTSVTDKSAT